MSFDFLDRASQYAACQLLTSAGSALVGTGVATLWAGGGGTVPLTLGSAMLLGAGAACQPGDLGPNEAEELQPRGCKKATGNCIVGAIVDMEQPGYRPKFIQAAVVETFTVTYEFSREGVWWEEWKAVYYEQSGKKVEEGNREEVSERSKGVPETFIQDPNCQCIEQWPDPGPPTPPLPPVGDITYTDSETNCNYNIKLLGFAEESEGGAQNPVWQIEGADEQLRADTGGRYGGCNFPPVVYYGGPGNPGPIPYTPGTDWESLLKNALAGALGNLLARAIADLLTPVIPASEFEFVAPCNTDADGNPLSVKYQLPAQEYQSRVISQQAVIMEILQQHLNWKTPICFGHDKGTYARSITFASNENTDNGNRRCTKRFGYRSNSPCTERQLIEHWRLFEWDTGPVCVKHSGSALGSPQVWATSVDEGKRVIQHAGREAGVDPYQVGEWSIGSSDNPRYGVSHTVKVLQVRGLWQATARQGPDGYATAYWSFPDPEVGVGP